jgi:hypothetical protein
MSWNLIMPGSTQNYPDTVIKVINMEYIFGYLLQCRLKIVTVLYSVFQYLKSTLFI